MRINTPLLFFFLWSVLGFAQSSQWTLLSQKGFKFSEAVLKTREQLPVRYQVYSLDVEGFQQKIESSSIHTIEFPTLDGVQQFSFTENSSLSPELAAKFPTIQSFQGRGIDDPSKTVVFSIGANGLHAVMHSVGESPYYLDSYSKNNEIYIAYQKKDLLRNSTNFECHIEEVFKTNVSVGFGQRNSGDGQLRTFRLALASTGEYSQFHLNQQNIAATATDEVKKIAVLSAMNTTITRVNAIFMRDLGVKMELVANNDELIFLDSETDDLSNSDASSLLNESQSKCDAVIGNMNYDIGHTFSTEAGGLAGLGVVCIDGQKGRGVTGRSQPINDGFDIDYVAHEIGHQFGGNHTFNGTVGNCSAGNRNNLTAVEPGSGSTIMAYAGICGSDNIQNYSDDYFHAVSIAEMWNNIQSSATCAILSATGNTAPIANAGTDFSIPKSTPFILKGMGTDADLANTLSYCWEQIDTEVNFPIPILSTNTAGAMFRSRLPKASPDRYLPELATVINGSTSSTWEVLPSVARDLNFSFLVRDQDIGAGITARDDLTISVVDATPFVVSTPATAVVWDAGTSQTISWEVGETNIAPINSQLVDIKLSTDGGLTFPITIVSNTPNDGTEEIVIPNVMTNSARIMVAAADHIFYNVNTTDFTINEKTASVKDFVFKGFNLYPNPSNGTFNLEFDVVNSGKVSVQIFDIRGVLVVEKNFYTNSSKFSKSISFSKASRGLYALKIRNDDKQMTQKLIIQ